MGQRVVCAMLLFVVLSPVDFVTVGSAILRNRNDRNIEGPLQLNTLVYVL